MGGVLCKYYNKKERCVTTLKSDKIDFKAKSIARY